MRRHGRLAGVLVCAALVLGAAHPTPAAQAGSIRNPDERRAAKRCDHGHVTECLRRAALHHHVSYPLLRAIAWCESRLNPAAVNSSSGASGLLQFMAATWAGTPYAARPRLSAKWNSLAGAWLLRRAGTSPWAASRHCWT